MTHASLFSGIGGFDLAANWNGIENIFQVEIDEFCQKVLKKNFPNVKRYKDIYEFDGKEYSGTIDIISGGFPCQPFSQAGKRKGTQDERYLWDEMFRIIKEVRPSWVIAENVYGLVNIENGLVLDKVLSDLETEGFEVQPFIIPACAKNASHRRDRIWIIGYSDGTKQGFNQRTNNEKKRDLRGRSSGNVFARSIKSYPNPNTRRELQPEGSEQDLGGRISNESNDVRDTKSTGQQNSLDRQGKMQHGGASQSNVEWQRNWIEVATELCRMDDGLSGRVDRLKSLGNAIVPQIASELLKCIKEVENSL